MPTTFYQRLQLYYSQPGAITFSKKKLKKISGAVNHVWDSRPQHYPLAYADSLEGDKTYSVRLYPNAFIKTIDGIILKAHASSLPAIPTPKRKRKPIKTQFYSSTKKTG